MSGLSRYNNNRPLVRHLATATRTLTFDDNNAVIFFNSETDLLCNLAPLAAGFHCWVVQTGVGNITIAGIAGATVVNVNSRYQTAGVGAMIKIISDDLGVYYITDTSGDGTLPPTDPPTTPAPIPCTNINAPGGTIVIPADYWINGITIKKLSSVTNNDFMIGLTAGGKQIIEDTITPGTVYSLIAQRFCDVDTTFYITCGFNACVKFFKQ